MQILVINPNTTAAMTEKIAIAARRAVRPDSTIEAVTCSEGPASIEGFYDEAFAVPAMLREVQQHPNADAVIIACFDDTGVDAARCLTAAPVLGIGEGAFHAACFLAVQYSVVTTLARSIPAITNNLTKYGLASRCASVRACDIPVLELESTAARARIGEEIGKALEQDGAEAIVLGCAGMTDLADALAEEWGVPVLDGVTCAVALAESIAGLGLKTSKRRGYAYPRAKAYTGWASAYAP